RSHFMARTRPIVRGECIERQLGDAKPNGRANNATHSCYAGAVSLGTWKSTHGSPAAVTVKQNGDVEAGTINQFRSRLGSHLRESSSLLVRNLCTNDPNQRSRVA